MRKLFFTMLVLLLLVGGLFADSQESEIILEDGIIDLRGVNTIPTRSGNEPGAASSMDELKIGSIFLTVDNHARKVVDIYENSGRTIIETIEPRPEEVFLALYVPDFEVAMGREHIIASSIADGVTVLPPNAGRNDMLSSDFIAPSEQDRSVTWLETDVNNDGKDVTTVNVNIPIVAAISSFKDIQKLKKLHDDARENNNPGETSDTGEEAEEEDGKPKSELTFNTSGEVWLKGTMRLVDPTFTGGIKKPKLKFSWVSKWWGGYFTIKHVSGYIKGGVETAMQLDMKLTGTVTLSTELKIPLYAVQFKRGSTEGMLGLYIKVGIDGSLSLSVEFSEYSWMDVGAKCMLAWPFIPYRVIGESDHYNNSAYRPNLAADAELKAGLYLGADLKVLGIGIMGAEAGGGAYIWAKGYIEPMGIMGYDGNEGAYGNFDDWILALDAEAGVYGEVTAEILSIDMTLWKKRWPFWEWSAEWGF